MNNIIKSAILFYICLFGTSLSAVINVPADQPTIQQGINVGVDGDTVLVADGIYTGMGNRNITFDGKAIVLRSANGPQSCIIDCESGPWEPQKGFYFIGEGRSTVLDGFTIKNGGSSQTCMNLPGGAIYCEGSPTIKNCIIIDNLTANNECRLSGGGGIYFLLGSPLMVNCVFKNNGSVDFGGAINSNDSYPVFIDCDFRNNYAPLGAAISSDNSHIILDGCSFIGNSGDFGIISLSRASEITASNCTVADNYSDSSATVYLTSFDTISVLNSILWNPSSAEIEADTSSEVSVSYSDIMGGWSGVGNIDCDPVFCEEQNNNYNLSPISCCLHAGDNGGYIGSSGVGCGAMIGLIGSSGGLPIADVSIFLMESEYYTQTGPDGQYMLTSVMPDTYNVLFTHDDYRDTVISGVVISDLLLIFDLTMIESGPCGFYTIGDVNGSGSYNGLDVTYGVSFFKGGTPPVYECVCSSGVSWFVSGDVNGSCSYNGLDITYGVSFFKGGAAPSPCPDCPPD